MDGKTLLGTDGEWDGKGYVLGSLVSDQTSQVFRTKATWTQALSTLNPADTALAGHSVRNDFRTLGYYPACEVYDSCVLAWLLDTNPPHGLKPLLQLHLHRHQPDPIHVTNKGEVLFNKVPIAQADQAEVEKYNLGDSVGTKDLARYLWSKLSPTMRDWYREVEMPLDRLLFEMEMRGIALDEAALAEERTRFAAEVPALEGVVKLLVGYDLNINSPAQLAKALYTKQYTVKERQVVGAYKNGKPRTGLVDVPRAGLGLKPAKGDSVDAASLLEHLGHPVVDALMVYRKQRDLAKFIAQWDNFLVDGRIHPNLNSTGTTTGRFSCNDPNLQQVPTRGNGKRLRKLFIAKPQHKLVIADLDQIEYRLLAHLSGEPWLIEVFQKGLDLHQQTATDVMKVKSREVGKTGNYAAVYLCGDKKFAQLCTQGGTPTTAKQAKAYRAAYYAKLPKVETLQQAIMDSAKALGFVMTLGRRRRYIQGLYDQDHGKAQAALRQAVNAVIQGSAADLMRLWMVECYLLGVPLLLQVHDELIAEVPEDEADYWAAAMLQALASAVKRLIPNCVVPITTKPVVTDNWGGKK